MSYVIAARARAVTASHPQGQSVRIVPILGASSAAPTYVPFGPGVFDRAKITEISEAGSVPELRVQNGLDDRLYLMDGQELIGAKQNRILNTDVMVPAGATLTIPVSCVEAHRWRHTSASFATGGSANLHMRVGKLARVHESLKSKLCFDANQAEVWNEVEQSIRRASAASPTRALSDAFVKRQRELTDFRRAMTIPDDAVGVAAFRGAKLAAIDIFDRHSTLKHAWSSLLDGYAIDLLATPVDLREPPASDEADQIERYLASAAEAKWEAFPSPGEGTDWRLRGHDVTGAALVWEDQVVIHLQLFPAGR